MAAKPKNIDWPAVELAYRAGIKSLPEIGKEFGCSHVAVFKRAKKDGWTRDLSARIKAEAERKVTASAVTGKVKAAKVVTEKAVVDANATMQADVILNHRTDIQALRRVIASMSGELGAVINTDLQEALNLVLDEKVSDLRNQQAKTALYKAFNAAMALSSHAGAGRQLAASLSTLIDKERQAFGIDKESGSHKSVGEFLDSL